MVTLVGIVGGVTPCAFAGHCVVLSLFEASYGILSRSRDSYFRVWFLRGS